MEPWSVKLFSWRRPYTVEMGRRSPLIAFLNRYIDEQLHKYFEDPKLCLRAITFDAVMHQYVEAMLGLSKEEIRRRTVKYIGKAMERCMSSIGGDELRALRGWRISRAM
ncbi:MAG: hypothetical protein QXO15_00485 [Nitrososphaerota archaeon]